MDKKRYDHRHNWEKSPYKKNNWMMEEKWIKKLEINSILEIGCGNGKFLESLIGHVPTIYGMDISKTELVTEMEKKGNIKFFHQDAREPIDLRVDMVISADFLEHLKINDFPEVIKLYDSYAPKQFHKIACYRSKDHHSVRTPIQWKKLFQTVDSNYTIQKIKIRKERYKVVCIEKGL